MLVLSIGKKSKLGIFLKMLIGTLWIVSMVIILPSCGDSPGYNYTISGGISGMVGSGMVLQNNGGDDLTITSNGSFSFNTALFNGAAYNVTVKTQPSSPSQNCVVSNNSGSINGSPVSNVAVSCTMSSHPVVVDTSSKYAYMGITYSGAGSVLGYTIASNTEAVPGALDKIADYSNGTNPAYITIYPSPASGETAGKYVYVTNFVSSGTIWCYTIDSGTGELTLQATVNAGKYPTAVTVDPTGSFAYTANMGDGTVSAYKINSTTGALTAVSGSPFTAGTSPTGVTIDPTGQFAYVANMYTCTISAYTINSTTGVLTAISGSPFTAGTYPTSVTIDPTGEFAYVSNTGSSDISAYTIASNTDSVPGALTEVSGSPFSAHSYPNPVTIDPTGSFAYVSNMGYSAISAYKITSGTGVLTEVSGSPFDTEVYPNTVTIDPSGTYAYVSNMDSDSISVYKITSGTGVLTEVSGSPFDTGTSPNTVTIDPSGKYAYVSSDGEIWVYTVNSDGTLTNIQVKLWP